MAAVHYLLLQGADHHLAAYYDTVRLPEEPALGPGDGDVAAVFADFCRAHRHELIGLITTRSTQTNEIGRCAALYPALSEIGGGAPLSLLDLGTSAGLNLLLDEYGYVYRQRSDGTERAAGPTASEVTIECTVRNSLDEFASLGTPVVASRTGLDLSPIDPRSDDEALWLQACLWPDNLPRFTRLRAALHVARTTDSPAHLVRGDLVDDLAQVATAIDDRTPLVIMHTWVAAYLTEARQRELVAAVRALRVVHHLYAESPIETPGLPTPESPEGGPTSNLATALVHIGPDGAPPVRLASMHPHGKWVRWWPTPTDPTGRRAEPAPGPPPR
jgi:hypothetical protein